VIVKLAEVAAASAFLPERGLPQGIGGLAAWRARRSVDAGHRLVREHGVPVRDAALFRRVGLDRIYVLKLPHPGADAVLEAVRELSAEPWVEYAEPAYLYEPLGTTPNDASFGQQWPHHNTGQTGGTFDADMDSPDAWDFGTGSSSIVIAFLDSGVDSNHPDLAPNLLPGVDLTGSAQGIEDDYGHGSYVAGAAAARGNNIIGIAGMCWTCKILPIKVFNDDGFISDEELGDAVRLAADSGADVINMSFGGSGWSQSFIDAVDYAEGGGALCVAAAGNFNLYRATTPAAYPNVLSVGGSTDDDAHFGDYGDHAGVAAPHDFLSTNETGGYALFWGTSGSAPLASGLAALLKSSDPNLHLQELRQLLRLGAEDQVAAPGQDTAGWDQYMGYGRLNADASVALIDGPWVALDRPHYVCEDTVHVDVKDPLAGATAEVSVVGHLSGDAETVSAAPVTAHGYYRGTIPLAWYDQHNPPVSGDGVLHVKNGDSVIADYDTASTSSGVDCAKRACIATLPTAPESGDCDLDGIADPGEIWELEARLKSIQTQPLLDVSTTLRTGSQSVDFIDDVHEYGDLLPMQNSAPGTYRLRIKPGSPANATVSLSFLSVGTGWVTSAAECAAASSPTGFSITANADGGGPDTWPGFPPAGAAGSAAACPAQFDLTWDAVAGASGYRVYRSEISCADAEFAPTPYASPAGTAFGDTGVAEGVEYFYAVEAVEPGTACTTERTCITGGCSCVVPGDPEGLRVDYGGGDVFLTWDDPAVPGLLWNVYRGDVAFPSLWGSALASGVADADLGTPGIQFVDAGGVGAGPTLFYRVTADNGCAESSLFDPGIDVDGDGVPNDIDNCPLVPNPTQIDGDGDGAGEPCDNCPADPNPLQEDTDGDDQGNSCDFDDDDDGVSDASDNCTLADNTDQTDSDVDAVGDACDPCPLNPDPECDLCDEPALTDPDLDNVCELRIVVEEGTAMSWRANDDDPGLALDWIEEGFAPDAQWAAGAYGIGYENATSGPVATQLIATEVPDDTVSVYTLVNVDLDGAPTILQATAGADYDDAYVIWINGVEIVRSPQMPPGDPAWNAPVLPHESSNGADPNYGTPIDVHAAVESALHDGSNRVAIGVWNVEAGSSELVLVPFLSVLVQADNCPQDANVDQADGEGDGVGDVCDNCPAVPNPGQEDNDDDGIGDACE
jgi:hypothetical protein